MDSGSLKLLRQTFARASAMAIKLLNPRQITIFSIARPIVSHSAPVAIDPDQA
jgi:hypothetical protein